MGPALEDGAFYHPFRRKINSEMISAILSSRFETHFVGMVLECRGLMS